MKSIERFVWIQENLRIRTKQGELVYLYANEGQVGLDRAIDLQRGSGLPVRIVLLKPRQVGWSTWISADAFSEVWSWPNRSALFVSDDLDGTNHLFSMVKLYDEELKPEFQRPKTASNRKEIIYAAPHRSSLLSLTAGKAVLGRGSTYQYVHGSEVAYWPSASERLGEALQAVPMQGNTTVVLESTAFGVGGPFYDTFVNAVERYKVLKAKNVPDGEILNGWLAVFFPWYKFSEYQVEVPDQMEFVHDDEEKELVAKFGLTDNQLYWRRLKLSEPGVDIDLFRQEYPCTWREAFQHSGKGVFSAFHSLLNKWESNSKHGRNVWLAKNERGEACLTDVGRSFNAWEIWELPKPGREYCIGVDTMEGRVIDTANIKSDWDKHGVVVLDRITMRVVALFWGQLDQQTLGEQVLLAGQMYNNAWIAPELPNGNVVLNVLKQSGYDYIYDRQKYDQRLVEADTEELGWRTTTATRPLMVESLIALMRDGTIDVLSKELIGQFRTFVRDKTGKPIHQPGSEDDLLFALMIAVQIHQRCPLHQVGYSWSHTYDDERTERLKLSESGAIDTFDPANDEMEVDCEHTM